MKICLVAGPPGAGSTTTAAAVAAQSAADGIPTTVVSADPYAPWPDGPQVAISDPAHWADQAWDRWQQNLGAVAAELEPMELATLPGARVAALLLDIARVIAAGECELLIVDAGADASALLSMPETAGFVLDAVVPTPLRLIRRASGRAGALAAAESVADRMLLARAALTGTRCVVHLVRPEQPARAAAADRLATELALLRFAADDSVTREGNQFHWQIPLPGANRAHLDLRRTGSDLVLTVYRATRRIELPSVLQRCELIRAALRDDDPESTVLELTFEPDPARWPQGLLDSNEVHR